MGAKGSVTLYAAGQIEPKAKGFKDIARETDLKDFRKLFIRMYVHNKMQDNKLTIAISKNPHQNPATLNLDRLGVIRLAQVQGHFFSASADTIKAALSSSGRKLDPNKDKNTFDDLGVPTSHRYGSWYQEKNTGNKDMIKTLREHMRRGPEELCIYQSMIHGQQLLETAGLRRCMDTDPSKLSDDTKKNKHDPMWFMLQRKKKREAVAKKAEQQASLAIQAGHDKRSPDVLRSKIKDAIKAEALRVRDERRHTCASYILKLLKNTPWYLSGG